MTVRVYVGLGANLGDRGEALLHALKGMAALQGTRLLSVSSLYSSAPVDATGPDYLNAVAALDTEQAPQAFLQALQVLEQAAGRERPYRNAPRTLDLDILLWGDQRMHGVALTVPHPRMNERAFVLRPLQELDARLVGVEHLAAVADQRITVAQNAQWAASALHG